jgi:hypothetical protein
MRHVASFIQEDLGSPFKNAGFVRSEIYPVSDVFAEHNINVLLVGASHRDCDDFVRNFGHSRVHYNWYYIWSADMVGRFHAGLMVDNVMRTDISSLYTLHLAISLYKRKVNLEKNDAVLYEYDESDLAPNPGQHQQSRLKEFFNNWI